MAEKYYQFNVSLYFYLLKVYFIYHNKYNDYYKISSEKRHLLMSKILGIE
jgi:hypothetical protein